MRVVILTTCVLAESWRVLRAGHMYDLPDAEAQSLVACGVARIADVETATVSAPETTARPPRRRQ